MADPVHVVCPACQAVNRVPGARLGEAPTCGRCHGPLFAGRPVELDTAGFERQVGRGDLPVLVDFWAPWCGPCKAMAPQFAEAARQLEPGVRLVKVNTDVEQGLAARLGIQAIPTLALFRGGREVARQAGALGAADLVRWARAQIG
jgi:thioredoxin 2